MLKGIDFKAVATKAAGHTAGAVAASKLAKLSFMQKLTNPVARGLVTAAIGYIGVPLVAKKLKLTGKKGGLVEAVGEGLGMVGILQAGNSKMPNLIPAVSGVDGYEDSPIMGLGEMSVDQEISGYEQNPILAGTDADGNFFDAED